MKHILSGTALVLIASLYGPTLQAAPIGKASGIIASPANGADYPVLYGDSIQIPISITNQYVEVSGNAPSSTISVTWKMDSAYGTPGGSGTLMAGDFSGGPRAVLTDSSGTYHRNINAGTTGNLSATLKSYGGNYAVDTESVITPAVGSAATNIAEHKFTVSVVH